MIELETLDIASEARELFIECLLKGGATNIKTANESFITFEIKGKHIKLYAAHYNTSESGLEIGTETRHLTRGYPALMQAY